MQASLQPITLAGLRTLAPKIFRGRPVRLVEVFGSVARGEARPDSDVDLLIEFTPGSQVGLLEMGAIREDLEAALGRPVDLLSKRAVERSRNPYRKKSILSAPVSIYVR